MFVLKWKLWKQAFFYKCNTCNYFRDVKAEFCEKCGARNSMKEATKKDYKTSNYISLRMYKINYNLIWLYIIVRIIEIILTIIGLNHGAIEVGYLAKYSLIAAILLPIPFLISFIIINRNFLKDRLIPKMVFIVIFQWNINVILCSIWNFTVLQALL